MRKINVIIVDDQYMARQLFELYIKSSGRYQLAGTASSGQQALSLVQAVSADLILMDILMPDGENGLETAARIKAIRPWIRIIAVTSMAEASWLKRAREIGIESFWYKESSKKEIVGISLYGNDFRGNGLYHERRFCISGSAAQGKAGALQQYRIYSEGTGSAPPDDPRYVQFFHCR